MENKYKYKKTVPSLYKKFFLFSFLSQFFFVKNLKAKNIKPKVIVIGSGFGGGTCIKFLSKYSKILDLHVIDKYTQIQTCPFSNLVIGNVMDYKDITFDINKNLEAKFHTGRDKIY